MGMAFSFSGSLSPAWRLSIPSPGWVQKLQFTLQQPGSALFAHSRARGCEQGTFCMLQMHVNRVCCCACGRSGSE